MPKQFPRDIVPKSSSLRHFAEQDPQRYRECGEVILRELQYYWLDDIPRIYVQGTKPQKDIVQHIITSLNNELSAILEIKSREAAIRQLVCEAKSEYETPSRVLERERQLQDYSYHDLLLKIESDGRWEACRNVIDGFGMVWLEELAQKSISKDVQALLAAGDETNLEKLLALETPIYYNGPGWYLCVITDDNMPGWFRLYNGQALGLRTRIREHHNSRQDPARGTLFYHIWNKPGRKAHFIFLGSHDQEMADQDRNWILNMVEMYFSLKFQTLPMETLQNWLPESEIRAPHIGLNVAKPLDQGHRKWSMIAASRLHKSADPEVLEYARRNVDDSMVEVREARREDEFRPLMHSLRARSSRNYLYRAPDPARGERTEFLVHCRVCKESIHIDPAPIVCASTGIYLSRRRYCHNHPDKNKHYAPEMIPVDPKIAYTSLQSLQSKERAREKRQGGITV